MTYLSIVIPTFNEAGRINSSLEKAWTYLKHQDFESEIVVADDGSTDDTAGVVDQFAASHTGGPIVRVLRIDHAGKGSAVQNGMLRATGDLRMFCDADFSMPIEELPKFLNKQADVVIGSREAPGARRFNEPAYRHIMGRVFNAIVQILAVRGLDDTQCGFKLFTAEATQRLFSMQTIDGFGFDVEILFLAKRCGYKIIEVPVDWYYADQSKVHPFRDTFRTFGDCLRVRLNALQGRYPI